MKKITVGILAHVDAGKTTLCESMLYECNAISKLGRVDNRDSYLDTHFEERRRGITIFSKQAKLEYEDMELTLIDTPGHSDFSAEMERSLAILDYALLIISATDGIQAHTLTLLSLLEKYSVPVFIFVTKMDVAKIPKEEIFRNIAENVRVSCMDFSSELDRESIAVLDESILAKYLDTERLDDTDIAEIIRNRELFPCYFGSGLKRDGIKALLDGIYRYSIQAEYSENLSGIVYKISHDEHGKRLSFVKLSGGSLQVRQSIGNEKITEIRIYSGAKYTTAQAVSSGDVCALVGLHNTFAGMNLGNDSAAINPYLKSVLKYTLLLPSGNDPVAILPKLRELEEEDPTLHIDFDEKSQEISVELMGQVQIDVLSSIIRDRFGIDVAFDDGHILYMETITDAVEGVGHYEPLKHYAEVHLLLEPLSRGSGIVVENRLSTDDLEINYQNLILSHITEKAHLGVLTGSPVTDIRITLLAGRSHIKHTEGGDFRQATYRAIRQGLMKANSVLLEPIYEFYMEVPFENTGRAISDIHSMSGKCDSPETIGSRTLLHGTAPVRLMRNYYNELMSYTSGKGHLALASGGYDICPDAEQVIESIDYSPVSDLNNSPDSVFCSHGSATVISWDKVDSLCHIPLMKESRPVPSGANASSQVRRSVDLDEAELESIMLREFGPIKRRQYTSETVIEAEPGKPAVKPSRIIIDGYNVIFSWYNLKELAADNIDLARQKLIDILVNYSSYTCQELVLVFDAYLVPGGLGSRFDEELMHIVYTKEGMSADAYIEQLISEIGKNESVKVVSSDSMIQITAVKSGVLRISSREFFYDVSLALENMRKHL